MKLTLTRESGMNSYMELFTLPKGTVFKVEDYDTVMYRIEELKEKGFEVYPITPGTILFTEYGHSHCIVTENRNPVEIFFELLDRCVEVDSELQEVVIRVNTNLAIEVNIPKTLRKWVTITSITDREVIIQISENDTLESREGSIIN